jgi:hypothetical protein
MTKRTITESQYMELREYEGHSFRWVNGGPKASLVSSGLIQRAAHDPSMFQLTPAGSDALSAFRNRYGLTT